MTNLTIEQKALAKNQFETVLTMSHLKKIQVELQCLRDTVVSFPKNTNTYQFRKAIESCIEKCSSILPNVTSKMMYDLVNSSLSELNEIPYDVAKVRLSGETIKCLDSIIADITKFIEPMWYIGY